MADIKISGLDGLLESLKALPAELVSKAGGPIQVGMRRGGNLIRDEARQRAPRGSGFLAQQIVVRRMNAKSALLAGASEYFTVGVRLGKKRKYANTKRNRRSGRAGRLYVTDGWAYYWRHLEFGTRKMVAKPFLTPAAEARGPEAAQVIIDQTRAAIDRIMKKRGWK